MLAAVGLAPVQFGSVAAAGAEDGCSELAWRGGCALSIGFDATPSAVASIDHDGDGVPSLFAAGAGGASGVAFEGLVRFVDGRWEPFGGRFLGRASKIVAADLDGDGASSLVVIGSLQLAPDGTTYTLLEWTGSTWIGRAPGYGLVDAVALDDDGDGVTTLYASAWFPDPSVPSPVVRWNGSGWAILSSTVAIGAAGFNPSSIPLAAFDSDGDGREELFATVSVNAGGVVVARGMARWNGIAWSAADGIAPPALLTSGTVRSICVADVDGDGDSELVAGGELSNVPVGGAPQVIAFDGKSWSGVGESFVRETPSLGVGRIRLVASVPVGRDGAPVLLAAGWFDRVGSTPAARVAWWDGAAWTGVGDGLADATEGPAKGLFGHDVDGDGDLELVGFGSFVTARSDGVSTVVNRAAAFDGGSFSGGSFSGGSWGPLGVAAGTIGLNGSTRDSALFDHDGDGRVSLVVAGSPAATDVTGVREFAAAGDVAAPGLAAFDGVAWQALAHPWPKGIEALLVADLDGDGSPSLFAAGNTGEPFTSTLEARSIAILTPSKSGGTWTPLPGRFGGVVRALAAVDHDLDGEPSLFVGGSFTRVDARTVGRLVRWDGAAWQGFDPGSGGQVINAITSFDDDGDGAPSMIVAIGGGSSSTAFQRIRRWTGSAWVHLGTMTQGHAFALQSFDDDGDGVPSLFAFGRWDSPAGIALAQRWQMDAGTGAWMPFGPMLTADFFQEAGAGLVAFDDDLDGDPSVFLYTTDPFSGATGGIQRATSDGWREVASRLAGGASRARVADLDGDGRASIYLDGVLKARPGTIGSGIGIIDACLPACPADVDGDGEVGAADLVAMLASWGACDGGACPGDLDGSGGVDAEDLGLLLSAWGGCP